MYIPREVVDHHCNKCKKTLIDSSFKRAGIILSGRYKNKAFFEYKCPHCGYKGTRYIVPDSDETPGTMFRQYADVLDLKDAFEKSKESSDSRNFFDDTDI